MKRIITVCTICMLVSSCALMPKFREEGWKPGVIAVLPFTNQSADVALEKFARLVLIEQLKKSRFQVVDIDVVDAKLDALGVSEGGQLATIAPEELAKSLGADSYLYGNILEAKRVMLGVYFKKMVHIEFKIVNRAGDRMWEDERTSQESKIVLNPGEILKTAAQEFVAEAATDLIMKALNSHPLIEHLRNVCTWSVSTLPR